MNKQRRKKVEDIIEKLEAIKLEVEELENEEQDSIDNLPENLQASQKAESMEYAVEMLNSAAGNIDTVVEDLQEILNS